MKKSIISMLAVALVGLSVPVFAMEHQHDASQKTMDAQCAKECDMLLRDCAQEVDSIQERSK
jgi:hypothetical protein